jgi:hypothetical protein
VPPTSTPDSAPASGWPPLLLLTPELLLEVVAATVEVLLADPLEPVEPPPVVVFEALETLRELPEVPAVVPTAEPVLPAVVPPVSGDDEAAIEDVADAVPEAPEAPEVALVTAPVRVEDEELAGALLHATTHRQLNIQLRLSMVADPYQAFRPGVNRVPSVGSST